MPRSPEAQAREEIDRLLSAAGWRIFDVKSDDIHAARGLALREFKLADGSGFADYMRYINGKTAGVIEAKKVGATLTGVEIQSGCYSEGVPASLPAWKRPLPFLYESTGVETHFTNGLDPELKARSVFAFHHPEMLSKWLELIPSDTDVGSGSTHQAGLAPARSSPRSGKCRGWSPEWGEHKLWPAQITAIRNLEKSLTARVR